MAQVRRKGIETVWVLVFAFFMRMQAALACPMCSELLNRGKDAVQAWRFGQGIAWSILLMLLMPVFLVGGIAFLILRTRRPS